MNHAVERIVVFFESLNPQAVDRLAAIYGEDAFFKDPFHEVSGLPRIQLIFRRMYQRLDDPRFVVTGRIIDGAQCCLTWDFHFRFRATATAQCIHGASHLVLAGDGRIRSQRDYWDAAELYEKLPLLGGVMRCLRRKAGD